MEFTLDDFVQYIQLKGNEGTKEANRVTSITYLVSEHYSVTYNSFNKGILLLYRDNIQVETVDLVKEEERNEFEKVLFSQDNIYDLIDVYYFKYIEAEEERENTLEKINKYFEK